MAYYKIKNITSDLAKRHQNKDTEIKIEYLVGFQKKVHVLPVNQELVFACQSLPVTIHSMRVKKLVAVTEISENEFMKLQKPSAKKTVSSEEEAEVKVTTTKAPENNNQKKSQSQQKKKAPHSTVFLKSDSN